MNVVTFKLKVGCSKKGSQFASNIVLRTKSEINDFI